MFNRRFCLGLQGRIFPLTSAPRLFLSAKVIIRATLTPCGCAGWMWEFRIATTQYCEAPLITSRCHLFHDCCYFDYPQFLSLSLVFLNAVPNACSQVQVPILLPLFVILAFQSAGRRFPCHVVLQPAASVPPSCCSHVPLPSTLAHVAFPGRLGSVLEAALDFSALLCLRVMLLPFFNLFSWMNKSACTAMHFLFEAVRISVCCALSGSGSLPIRVPEVTGASIQFMCACLCRHYCAASLWIFPM